MVKRKTAAASASADGTEVEAGGDGSGLVAAIPESGVDEKATDLGGDDAAASGDGGQVQPVALPDVTVDSAGAETLAGQAEPGLPDFPCHVVIRNNSGIALADPVSGAFAQAGGSATLQLHDREHASEVVRSLTAFAEANYIPFDKLAIEPA